MNIVKIDIYFDGSCKNVKDSIKEPFGYGVAVFIDEEYSEVYSGAYEGLEGTNNIAEWAGCVKAMEIAETLYRTVTENKLGELKMTIHSDSMIVTRQFNGTFAVKQEHFRPMYLQARKIAKSFGYTTIKWVPRELNKHADKLAGEGRQNILKKISK